MSCESKHRFPRVSVYSRNGSAGELLNFNQEACQVHVSPNPVTPARTEDKRQGAALLIAPLALFVVINSICLYGFTQFPFAAVVRVAYGFNTVALPGCLMLVAFLAWRRKSPQRLVYSALIVALALVGVRIYATHIEPHRLALREVTIHTEKVSRPLRILHISDIQAASIGRYEERAIAWMKSLEPDLIIHTGDFLQPVRPATYHTESPKLAALINTLDPPLGIYAVQGDTTGPLLQLTPEELGGVRYLQNEEAVFELEDLHLRLYGLTLRSSTARTWARGGIRKWLALEPDALNIVAGHRPDYILKMNDLPIDLCLAGHTHGGQIRIPFYGPPVTFSRIPRAWARGLHRIGNTWLNVSAGIGAEHHYGLPSIRLNCPPEMTLITVQPA